MTADLEREQGVRVLYACEGGSRAYGLDVPGSDYDVRFVYVQTPGWYFRLRPGPDTLTMKTHDGLDMHGWELRKALGLFAGSNVSLLEWLGSPVVYLDREGLADRMRQLVPDYFRQVEACHQYLGQVRKAELVRSGPHVLSKEAMHAIRTLLAARWIARTGQPAVTCMADLLLGSSLPPALTVPIWSIGARLGHGGLVDMDPELSRWMADELDRLTATVQAMPRSERPPLAPLEAILHHYVTYERMP